MSRAPRTTFVCQECGAQAPKWLGRCADCGAWNSFVEERTVESGGAPAAGHRYALTGAPVAARLYADIEIEQHARLSTGIGEFDRVLGGGIVPGSLVLLGGEPGIGKSTLLLQASANIARAVGPVLYSSGEESEHQVKSRGERLGVGSAPLFLLAETCLERILEEIARIKPALVVVDSIQTVFSLKFQSAPGSIGQVREAATQLLFTAKGQNVPILLVGHVTKEGSLAGPKALEHVVDTVLYFEGERHHAHRVVRAVKNRFGAVSELGVFEMTAGGLDPVANPSALFLAERPLNAPGSAVLCSVEGSRPILVEVQALVSTSTYGTAPPAGWPAASISSGSRCSSRCSKSARASISRATMCS
jgi:DNA repair protein RadA/Sms